MKTFTSRGYGKAAGRVLAAVLFVFFLHRGSVISIPVGSCGSPNQAITQIHILLSGTDQQQSGSSGSNKFSDDNHFVLNVAPVDAGTPAQYGPAGFVPAGSYLASLIFTLTTASEL